MERIVCPEREKWPDLCRRPVLPLTDLRSVVCNVFDEVRKDGDTALLRLTRKFDGANLSSIKVCDEDIRKSADMISGSLREAINLARANIETFHSSQAERVCVVETSPGVKCWRETRAIERVGLYIPGGTAPLFSTVLMLAIPASLAGCREIVLCTPPDKKGNVNPVILYAASVTGVTSVYSVGGAQAIAAMTFGTESVPAVNKIFGPGNQYVTSAKQKASELGVAIDMPAGPSELLVIADSRSNPDFVAADLLSQAEHGPDSQVILLSNDIGIIERTFISLDRQLSLLPRRSTASRSLEHSKAIIMKDLNECIQLSNLYAPEHLIIATSDPGVLAAQVTNAGSVFLGRYSCESAGDYASGTNHTLPTNGYAKSFSGVSLDSFLKKITFQELSYQGLRTIGDSVIAMAETEGLTAHANAVSVRLKKEDND